MSALRAAIPPIAVVLAILVGECARCGTVPRTGRIIREPRHSFNFDAGEADHSDFSRAKSGRSSCVPECGMLTNSPYFGTKTIWP